MAAGEQGTRGENMDTGVNLFDDKGNENGKRSNEQEAGARKKKQRKDGSPSPRSRGVYLIFHGVGRDRNSNLTQRGVINLASNHSPNVETNYHESTS